MSPIPEPRYNRVTLKRRLQHLDVAATDLLAVRLPHPPALTAALSALSRTANYGLLWFALALVSPLAGAAHEWQTFAFVSASVLVTEWLTFAVKLVVRRRRPSVADPTTPALIPLPASHSFPSSHASMGVAGMMTLGYACPGWLPALAVLVALLAFSRVYLRVHYLADVVAGLAFGALTGTLALVVYAAVT